MGQRHLNAMAVEFLRLYPDIELELVLDDRFVDPREERIDVSLRVGGALPPDLVARTWARGRACWWRHQTTWPRAASHASRKTCWLHDYMRYAAGDDGVLLRARTAR
jgi:DNA-binding transcriptional LysR family regulator